MKNDEKSKILRLSKMIIYDDIGYFYDILRTFYAIYEYVTLIFTG